MAAGDDVEWGAVLWTPSCPLALIRSALTIFMAIADAIEGVAKSSGVETVCKGGVGCKIVSWPQFQNWCGNDSSGLWHTGFIDLDVGTLAEFRL